MTRLMWPLALWLGALFLVSTLLNGCSPPSYHWPRLVAQGQRVTIKTDAQGLDSPAAASMVLVATIEVERVHWDPLTDLQHDFIIWHEWCHLDGVTSEAFADCCAIKQMAASHQLWGSDVADLVLWVQPWEASIWHPSGVLRAASIMACAP